MPITRKCLEQMLLNNEASLRIFRVVDVSLPEPASAAGENYTSQVCRVKAEVVLQDGTSQTLSLIVKESPPEGRVLEFLKAEAAISAELKAYREILPHMKEVLEEIGQHQLWANFIGYHDRWFIFSDLKTEGFEMTDRIKRQDLEHTLLVMKGLALFHATSVVLKERGKLDVAGLKAPYIARDTPGFRKYRRGAIAAGTKTMLENWGPEWTDIAHRLRKKSFDEEIEKLAEVDETRLNVLCHGDPWTTNIFFRQKKDESILHVDIRFVDFQLISYNSYAYDLVYFLGTSTPKELRRRSKKEVLQHYTKALRQYLELYGLSHLAPTYEQVQAEVKRLDPYLFFVLFSELPIQTSLLEDAFVFDKLVSDDEDPPQNPKMYEGDFKFEIDEELLQWAEEKWF